MDRSRIALIVPALNEARTIGEVVRRSAANGTVIVVDDGSSDGTAETARAAGADVVTHSRNRGYDAALNSGFQRASALGVEYAITLDADGQHDPNTIGVFMAQLAQGADVVVGVRDRRQRFAEHVFAWYGRRVWGIRDPLCGMKGYRMAIYAEHGCFDSCSSVGTELAVCTAVRGRLIQEVLVPTAPRIGEPRFGNRLRGNARILRALFAVANKASRLHRALRQGHRAAGGI